VRGDVRAPDASPAPDVNVTLTSEEQAHALSAETDEEGEFAFPNVPPRNYVLRLDVPGFDPVQKPVVVGSGPVPCIRMKLKIAQVSEKVTVSAQSIVLAEDNCSEMKFNEHLVTHLPSRDAAPLAVPSLFLNPAVSGASGPTLIVDGVDTSSLDLPTSSVKALRWTKIPIQQNSDGLAKGGWKSPPGAASTAVTAATCSLCSGIPLWMRVMLWR